VLPEEVEAQLSEGEDLGEEYGSPRETSRDNASSCSEGDYPVLLGSPLRGVQDGAALVRLRSLSSLPPTPLMHVWAQRASQILC
jgi:hypothetical protein